MLKFSGYFDRTIKLLVWRILALSFLILQFSGCNLAPPDLNYEWSYSIIDHGTSSTPRFADLNGDQVDDVVMGAGMLEHRQASHGVIALDGKSGELLWHVPSVDQMVGSAVFLDINHDQFSDVVIGGRTTQLLAINGRNGDVIWRYEVDYTDPKAKFAAFNFYNAQILPDLDDDGVGDILISNGGNVFAPPYSEESRKPGVLMVLSGANGQTIALDTMPDGKETYFSPVLLDLPGYNEKTIIFGSGGETVSGHLYATTLDDLLVGDISKAKILLSETGRGFIAPVTLSDMNQDGIPDITGVSHRATIFSIDGKTLQLSWKRTFEGVESSSMVIAGNFRSMEWQDVFANISIGSFPANEGAIQLMLDGRNGTVIYQDTMGCFGFSSPILVQYDSDPLDEVMYSINSYRNCGQLFSENINEIVVADLNSSFRKQIIFSAEGKNLSVTPSVVDLDHDRSPELIYVLLANFTNINDYFGMSIKRIKVRNLRPSQKWNTYMGTHYNCIIDT